MHCNAHFNVHFNAHRGEHVENRLGTISELLRCVSAFRHPSECGPGELLAPQMGKGCLEHLGARRGFGSLKTQARLLPCALARSRFRLAPVCDSDADCQTLVIVARVSACRILWVHWRSSAWVD